ncbi:hypothetical protein U6O62_12150, partial [Cutibacterium acnes]
QMLPELLNFKRGLVVSRLGGPPYFNFFFKKLFKKRLFHILYSQSRPAAYGSELITCTIIHPIDEILCRHAGEAV